MEEKINKKIKFWANKLDIAERNKDMKAYNNAVEKIQYYEGLLEYHQDSY